MSFPTSCDIRLLSNYGPKVFLLSKINLSIPTSWTIRYISLGPRCVGLVGVHRINLPLPTSLSPGLCVTCMRLHCCICSGHKEIYQSLFVQFLLPCDCRLWSVKKLYFKPHSLFLFCMHINSPLSHICLACKEKLI